MKESNYFVMMIILFWICMIILVLLFWILNGIIN